MKRGYCFDIVRQVQHSPVMILYSLSTILDQQLEQEDPRIIQTVIACAIINPWTWFYTEIR